MLKAGSFKLSKIGFLGLCIAAANTALAQESEDEQVVEEQVVVTGYLGSLQTSTEAKRNSVGFVDEVFADDIGKMPSQNLAESLSRIPGVKVSREVTGEGQQITVRGLGSSFTKVVMNGNSIAVASDGSMGSGQRGRHVDLDMFPPELFSSLAVNKTMTADQVEGGVSGYVNMRTMRASDLGEGSNFRFSLEGAYNENASATSPRVSGIYGYSEDNFGVLFGVVVKNSETRMDGWETIIDYNAGCVVEWNPPGTGGCVPGSASPNNFNYASYATPDYAAANGMNVGDPIDYNALSGLSDAQMDTFGLPYIARPMYMFGDRDVTSSVFSANFEPSDSVDLNLDVMYSEADRHFLRNELNVIYRRNYVQHGLEWLLEDVSLNELGNFQSGTLWNNVAWLGSRDTTETLDYLSIMPSVTWRVNDEFKVDVSASKTDSDFERDEPYLFAYSPTGPVFIDYGNDFPIVDHAVDMANATPGWTWDANRQQHPDAGAGAVARGGEFRFARNSRSTGTKSFNIDFAWGEDPAVNGILFGFATDENDSDMVGYNSSEFFGRTAGTVLETDFQSLVVDSPIKDYGSNISGYYGIDGIVSFDWKAVKDAVDYANFDPVEAGTGDQFGQTVGDINEKVSAFYLEANSESEIVGRVIRTNLGVRLVDTEQTMTVDDDDPNTPEVETNSTKTDYTRILPSVSAVLDVRDDIKVRASASRSFTRANPSSMFPTTAWTSSGIETLDAGNPFLQPFESTNFDIGGEWYFGGAGYVGLTYYEKDITGFTREDSVTVQYLELAGYGVDISPENVTPTQQQSLDLCGGRTSEDCTTIVSTDVNIDGVTKLYGYEVIWVMPLDMWVDGLGFNTSMNKIDQDASDPDGEIFGLADSLNFTAYYENDVFQSRITLTRTDEAEVRQNPYLLAAEHSQVDFSASYKLPVLKDYDLTLTFDAYNLTGEPLHTFWESDGHTYNYFYPGATYTFGIRGSF